MQLHPAGDRAHRPAGHRDLDRGRLARRWPSGSSARSPSSSASQYARLAILLNEARGWAKGTLPTYQDRKAFFEGIVNGEPDPIALLRAGDEAAVRDLIAAAQRTHTPATAL